MTVLLPTTLVTVHRRQPSTDAHGHRYSGAAVVPDAGPYPASIQYGNASELDLDGTNVVYTHTAYIDPAAWPVMDEEQIIDADGTVYGVVSAALVEDPMPTLASDLAMVVVALQRVERSTVR